MDIAGIPRFSKRYDRSHGDINTFARTVYIMIFLLPHDVVFAFIETSQADAGSKA